MYVDLETNKSQRVKTAVNVTSGIRSGKEISHDEYEHGDNYRGNNDDPDDDNIV